MINLVVVIDKILKDGISSSTNILELQVALKLLGFMPRNYMRQCDGIYGKTTQLAIRAFQSYKGMARGNYDITDEVNKCLLDSNWFKVPFVENPQKENDIIVKTLDDNQQEIIEKHNVPYPFLRAILWQETGLRHYDDDGFVFIGCDFGITHPEMYRSRGWGIGQYTITNHPPTVEQVKYIVQPLKNIIKCIDILKEKYQLYAGRNKPLCKYSRNDREYMKECFNCLEHSLKTKVVCPSANYHPQAQIGYDNVPLLTDCNWGIAIERYNGTGQNAIAYRAEVLLKVGEEKKGGNFQW